MKITFNWLKLHSKIENNDIDRLSEQLMKIGMELDSYDYINPIYIGKIINLVKKDGVKVSICTVETIIKGEIKRLQILCGAHNARIGLTVVFAPVGTIIGGVTITSRKICGYNSQGMILSDQELGHCPTFAHKIEQGIMECDSIELGLYTYDDILLEIETTPNRWDFKSVRNIAQNLNLGPMIEPKHNYQNTSVKINNPNKLLCNIAYIENFKINPIINQIMSTVGKKSNSNLQTFNDFITLDLGHPVNIMDADQIKGDFQVIQDKNHWILKDDHKKLAYIGSQTLVGYNNNTQNIFIEVSYPDYQNIHTYNNTSSYFKGLNHHQNTIYYLLSYLNAQEHPAISGTNRQKQPKIIMTWSEYYQRTGEHLSMKQMQSILSERSFQTKLIRVQKNQTVNDEFALEIIPPTWRTDIVNSHNIIEEVHRKVIYDHIKPEKNTFHMLSDDDLNKLFINNILISHGFSQKKNLPFTETGSQETAIYNPINEKKPYLRENLWSGLLEMAIANKRSFKNIKIFEWGNVFNPESQRISILLGGKKDKDLLNQGSYSGKDLKNILSKLPVKTINIGKKQGFYYMDGIIDNQKKTVYGKSFDISFTSSDTIKWSSIEQLANYPLIPFDIYEYNNNISYSASYYCENKENLAILTKKLLNDGFIIR